MSELLKANKERTLRPITQAQLCVVACAGCPLFKANLCGGKKPNGECPPADVGGIDSVAVAGEQPVKMTYKKELLDDTVGTVRANLSKKPALSKTPQTATPVPVQKMPSRHNSVKSRQPSRHETAFGNAIADFVAACLGNTAVKQSSKLT